MSLNVPNKRNVSNHGSTNLWNYMEKSDVLTAFDVMGNYLVKSITVLMKQTFVLLKRERDIST